MRRREILVFGCVLLTALLGHSLEAVAAKRGAPNSKERKAFCKAKLNECIDREFRDCEAKYPKGGKGWMPCNAAGITHCKERWGDESDCNTTERRRPTTPSQPGLQRAPGTVKPPARPSLQSPRVPPTKQQLDDLRR